MAEQLLGTYKMHTLYVYFGSCLIEYQEKKKNVGKNEEIEESRKEGENEGKKERKKKGKKERKKEINLTKLKFSCQVS